MTTLKCIIDPSFSIVTQRVFNSMYSLSSERYIEQAREFNLLMTTHYGIRLKRGIENEYDLNVIGLKNRKVVIFHFNMTLVVSQL